MKISIALASYNGARFIREQLDSFARQTRLPDEVVVSDDMSTDETRAIVEAFALEAPFTVKLHVASERLGYTDNFQRAISLCQGDLIFLSDQDDVWFDTKLEVVTARYEARSDVHVVINDQIMTDGQLRPGNATKLGNLRRLGKTSDGMIEGCCTAVSAVWARAAMPVPTGYEPELQELLSYDRWLNELAILLRIRVVEEQPLQYFRRHGANVTAWVLSEPRRVSSRDLLKQRVVHVPADAWRLHIRLMDVYLDWLSAYRTMLEQVGIGDVDRAVQTVQHERASHERRIALTRKRLFGRLSGVYGLLRDGGYRYFWGWKSALHDIVRPAR